MSYADITIYDPNPIKKRIHQYRLKHAISYVKPSSPAFYGDILDFGGGNGILSTFLAKSFPKARIYCYEPAPNLYSEAEQTIQNIENIHLISSIDKVYGFLFDFIFCLEVFEHLPPRQSEDALNAVASLLSDTGTLVVSVPIEIYFPAILKGLFRMFRRFGDYDASIKNIFHAALGRPFSTRPSFEIGPGLPYYAYHTGFDYRCIKKRLMEQFNLIGIEANPIGFLGTFLNNNLDFILTKKI